MGTPQDSIFAGRMLLAMAGRVTEVLSIFSGWLIGSAAAVAALLLYNIDALVPYLSAGVIGSALKWFLAAVGLHVVQRYLGAIVAGGVTSGHEMEELAQGQQLDFGAVMEELERASFWPARYWIHRMVLKVQAGDFAAGGRFHSKIAQIQGFMVLAQMALILRAGYLLAGAL